MYSQSGEGAQILKRISDEGNDCVLFIKDKVYKSVFDGLLEKTDIPNPDKDTIVLFDMSGNGQIADGWRRKGHHVFGASSFADQLEHDRQFGFNIMEQAGIQIPEYKEFTTFKEGLDFVREANKELLVFKPSGSMPTKLTYVSKSSEELASYMTFVEKRYGKHIKSFILQEFIKGTVVSSEAFCMGEKGFRYPFNHTVEVKKSMNDDLGPSTGCSGNIAWACETDHITLAGVELVEAICRKEGYFGQIDLNAVVNDSGVYGLEWTPRFGYDSVGTLLSLLEMDFGELFAGLAKGQLKEIPLSEDYAGSVRVTIPPYPAEFEKDSELLSPNMGVPILGYEGFEEDIYFYEVCFEDDVLLHSGGTGVIACVIGQAGQADHCLNLAYQSLEEIIIPDKQYRTDLVDVLSEMVEGVNEYAAS